MFFVGFWFPLFLQNRPVIHINMQTFFKPMCQVCLNYTHVNIKTSEQCRIYTGEPQCEVYWGCVCLVCVWLHALAPERPSYPSCPPLHWLLNQMVPSFLAVPGHLAPQPTAGWDPEPCRWFITHRNREGTQPQPLLTSLSILLPFISLHSLNPTCQPYYFLTPSPSNRKIDFQGSVLFISSRTHLFLLEFFLLIFVAHPPFCVSCSWKTQGLRSLSHVFLIPQLFFFIFHCGARWE